MSDPKTLWRDVLCETTREQLRLLHGVTIPFMVGVYYEKEYLQNDELENSDCIKKIFDLIVDNLNDEEFLLVEDCIQNEEAQGTYLDKITNNDVIHILQWPQTNDTKNGRQDHKEKIYFPKNWNFNGNLILQLWDFYGVQIKEHKFSWASSQSKWNVFSNSTNEVDELSIIKNL